MYISKLDGTAEDIYADWKFPHLSTIMTTLSMFGNTNIRAVVCFYHRVSIASYANRWYSQRKNVRLSVCPSVCLSVCHTPVLYQNEES